MGKYVSEALQLRLELQVKLGRTVSQREVAREVTKIAEERGLLNRRGRAKVEYRFIMTLENNQFREPDLEIAACIAAYFEQYGLDGGRVLRYVSEESGADETLEDRSNNIRALQLAV